MNRSLKVVLIIGMLTLVASTIIHSFFNAQSASLLLGVVEFLGGFVIVWVVKNVFSIDTEGVDRRASVIIAAIACYIGMWLGSVIQLLLIQQSMDQPVQLSLNTYLLGLIYNVTQLPILLLCGAFGLGVLFGLESDW